MRSLAQLVTSSFALMVAVLWLPFQAYAQQTIEVDPTAAIDAMQASIQQQGATFEVADYPDLSRVTLQALAATAPPDDLALQALQQVQISEGFAARNARIASLESFTFEDDRANCDVRSAQFDWRDLGDVTGVKDQEDCGACWAFAAMAAFESSYSIINEGHIDGSEQHLLDCSVKGDCNGGWFSHPLNLLRDQGGLLTKDSPYVAIKGACTPTVVPSYHVANWGYVERSAGIPSISAMKRALCEHGPVAAAVLVTPLFQRYKSGVFNEFQSGDGTSSVNHGILVVGWNDNTKSWIIKNSWNSNWGEEGFMRIRYNSNNIGFGAVWVDAAPNAIAQLLSEGLEDFAASVVQQSPLLHQMVLPSEMYELEQPPEEGRQPGIEVPQSVAPQLQMEDFFAIQ